MGAAICGFGQTSPKILHKQDTNDRKTGGLTTSIIEFMRPRCLWRGKRQKMMTQFHPHGKQQQLLKNMGQQLTLEQWLLASPGPLNGCANGGEFCALKPYSKRVYPSPSVSKEEAAGLINSKSPSLSKEEEAGLINSKPRERFSLDREEVKVGELDRGDVLEDSSLCRNPSGKIKKRVSFRFPEVADIILFEST